MVVRVTGKYIPLIYIIRIDTELIEKVALVQYIIIKLLFISILN